MPRFFLAPPALRIICRDPQLPGWQRAAQDSPAGGWRRRLLDGLCAGVSEPELRRQFDALEFAALVLPCCAQLLAEHLLCFSWQPHDRPLLRIEPLTARFGWRSPAEMQPGTLSRFAYLRRDGATFVLESSEASCTIRDLAPELGGWLLTPPEAAPPDPLYGQLWALLALAGFLEPRGESSARRSWEFHDRLFHTQSTLHRLDQPLGATYRLADELPFPSAPAPPAEAERCDVPAPDPAALDAGLRRSLHQRRSVREHGAQALRLAQLATLLAVAFGRSTQPDRASEPQRADVAPIPTYHKAYASAGGIHELGLYLIVRCCDGLAPGVYAYDEQQHQLWRLPQCSRYAEPLLSNAAHYWGRPDQPPQIVALLTSRLEQLAWKYEGLAYRLTLLNAGGALQTLQLVASALGIASCALGGIDTMLMQALEPFDEIRGVPLVQLALGQPDQPPPHATLRSQGEHDGERAANDAADDAANDAADDAANDAADDAGRVSGPAGHAHQRAARADC